MRYLQLRKQSVVLAWIVFSFIPRAMANQNKGPQVLSFTGSAEVMTVRDKEFRELKNKSIQLREQARLRTEDKGSVKLQISPQLQITLLSNTEVFLPGISWDTGEVPVIELIRGSMVWEQQGPKASELRSALFNLFPPQGLFIFEFHPTNASALVKVFLGKISFKAMNAEHTVSVGEGQKVQFQGVIEEGEIAYDILLKGRKVPRGVLGKAEKMSEAEKNYFSEIENQRMSRKKKQQLARKKAESSLKKSGAICTRPQGRLNDCAWICENNPRASKTCQTQKKNVVCYRTRCNANGVWADRFDYSAEIGKAMCRSDVKVGTCDY